MGLDMNDKRILTNQVSARYQQAGKKAKDIIPDGFIRTTGYTRKYAIHLLNAWNTTRWVKADGKLARFKTGTPKNQKKERGQFATGLRSLRWSAISGTITTIGAANSLHPKSVSSSTSLSRTKSSDPVSQRTSKQNF
jgi:hypothetical protein